MRLSFWKRHRSFYLRMTKAKYQEIEEILCKQITDGGYQVGDLIPKEIELAAKYQVSRPTISHAVQWAVNGISLWDHAWGGRGVTLWGDAGGGQRDVPMGSSNGWPWGAPRGG